MMFGAALKYINDQFGIEFIEGANLDLSKMPLFLRNGYGFLEVKTDDVKLLLVDCTQKKNLSGYDLIKNVENIQRHSGHSLVIVLIFDVATNYLREILIKAKIAFVIPGKQIYIPVLGSLYIERMQPKYKVKKKLSVSKMQPTTQALLLNLLATNDFDRTMEELAKELSVSKMSISRAFKELHEMGIVAESNITKGCTYLFNDRLYEIWRKGEEKLINPIMKEIYILGNSINEELQRELVVSGESALSEYSMLGAPRNAVFGITSKRIKAFQGTYQSVPFKDYGTCVVEIWKHEMPIQNGIVDPLGIAVLLLNEGDERIEISIREMMEDYSWKE